ncbi:MAG: hypothetical protein EHM31_13310, partial [Candidatus Aminicenantes bacterium]
MFEKRVGIITWAAALLWLIASPALEAAGVPRLPSAAERVPFSLAEAPPRPEPKGKKRRAWLDLATFSTATTVNYCASNSFPEDRDFGINVR